MLGGGVAEGMWSLLTPTSVAGVSIALAAAWLLLLHVQSKKASVLAEPAALEGSAGEPQASCVSAGEMREGPNLQGTFIPSTGLVYANQPQPSEFETDNTVGLFLPLHRPTWNKALDKSCRYPHGGHFIGRKRLWEMRFQFRFKQDVTTPLLLGIELEQYVPLNAASKKLMSMTVAALRKVAGSDLYHSPGDDPRRVVEPHEKPVFSMPLWAVDQYIVTPEWEEPPDLTDPDFSELGTKRTDGRAAFIAEISALKLQAGPTYTFALWGISQFLDQINWEMTKIIPFRNFDFNLFCGAPPVHLVFYNLLDDPVGERRHLQSRKNYYFRLAFWSSKHPPSQEKVRALMPRNDGDEPPAERAAKKRRGWSHKLHAAFACCSDQRQRA